MSNKIYIFPPHFRFSSELQLEMRRREQRKLEEEQEELQKWRKKLRDRQIEDEEFKVFKNYNSLYLCNVESYAIEYLVIYNI